MSNTEATMENAKRILSTLTAATAADNVLGTDQTRASFDHAAAQAHEAGLAQAEINEAIYAGAAAAQIVAKGRRMAKNF